MLFGFPSQIRKWKIKGTITCILDACQRCWLDKQIWRKKKNFLTLIFYLLFNFLQANLLSSHRIFLKRVDVIELINSVGSKGDALSLLLFSDNLEVSYLILFILKFLSTTVFTFFSFLGILILLRLLFFFSFFFLFFVDKLPCQLGQ